MIISTNAGLEWTPRPVLERTPQAQELRKLISELIDLRDSWYENPLPTVEGWVFALYDAELFVPCLPVMMAKSWRSPSSSPSMPCVFRNRR